MFELNVLTYFGRMQPVIREITDSRARTREELEALYRKIVSAILLRSGLGSPTDIAVVREATGTISCICPKQKKFSFFPDLNEFKDGRNNNNKKIFNA